MKNPKIKVIQNAKGEWHFKLIAKNGKSVLIGGETFKNKPSIKMLLKLSNLFAAMIDLTEIEYFPRKKK